MAKTKPKKVDAGPTVLEFIRTGNPWIDAGIVGLYRVADGRSSYMEGGVEKSLLDEAGVRAVLTPDRLTLTGSPSEIHRVLEAAYDRLVSTYFDVSSRKQRDDRASYNFYYDSEKQTFVAFPKKKAAGAASLLFDKAARPSGSQVPWGEGGDGKKQAGILPASHAELQAKLDKFLGNEGLKAGPPAGLLIDGPNTVRPKVAIKVGAKTGGDACFLVGDGIVAGVEAKETAFPLLGGSRAFVNGSADWPRLGWKIDLVGKFVPAVTFFYRQGDDLHLFFPESDSLKGVDEVADTLTAMLDHEPNLFRNFEFHKSLGGYFSGRSEVLTAFLHRVFVTLTDRGRRDSSKTPDAPPSLRRASVSFDDEGPEESDLEPEQVGEEVLISSRDIFEATQRGGTIGFTVVSAVKKGNVWMARDFWTFRDVVYLARLFEVMGRPVKRSSGPNRPLCAPGSVFRALMDFEAKDQARSLTRDRVCEAVLHRRSVLRQLERHAFHVNTHSDASKSRTVYPLLQFARLYEVELRKGDPMGNAYENMVQEATRLGDAIGQAVAAAVKPKAQGANAEPGADEEGPGRESRGQARGALFRLRKTRSIADFMNELARLQFRYGLDVPRYRYAADVLNPENFEDFRGFCVVAALSRFLSATHIKAPASEGAN